MARKLPIIQSYTVYILYGSGQPYRYPFFVALEGSCYVPTKKAQGRERKFCLPSLRYLFAPLFLKRSQNLFDHLPNFMASYLPVNARFHPNTVVSVTGARRN